MAKRNGKRIAIATIADVLPLPEQDANQALIAAAPDLLEALKELHKNARGMWNELLAEGFADKGTKMPCHDVVLAAIARAEGRICD